MLRTMKAWLNHLDSVLSEQTADGPDPLPTLRNALPFAALAFLLDWISGFHVARHTTLDAVTTPLLTVLLVATLVLLTVRKTSARLVSALLLSAGCAVFFLNLTDVLFTTTAGTHVTLELTRVFVWVPALVVVSSRIARADLSLKVITAFFGTIVLMGGLYALTGHPPTRIPVLLALAELVLANVALCALTLSSADHERQRNQQTQQMQTIALSDPLTGLANRLGLEHETGLSLAHVRRTGDTFALLYLDLDGFKDVNDTLGHEVGDDLLREVATRLGTVRRGTDVLARPGGDEFVLLARGADTQAAREITLRIQQTFRPPFASSRGLPIGASVGYSTYPEDGTDMTTLMDMADRRMYAVKRVRKAKQRDRRTQHGHMNVMDIIARLEQSQLALIPTRLPGGELHLCLSNPEHPTMTADDIASNAMSNGHQEQLWNWWTQQAAAYLSNWQNRAVAVMPLPQSVMYRGFAAVLLSALHDRHVNPSSLRIEVPGSSVHRQSKHLTEYRTLIDAGVRLRLNEVSEEPAAQQISRDLAKILNANLESIELQSHFDFHVDPPIVITD